MMKTNKSITEKLPWWHHHSAVVRIFFKFIFSPTFSREFPVFFFVFFFIVASHQILPTALFKGFKAASTQRTTHWFQGEWKSYLRSCVGVNKTSLSETNIFLNYLFFACPQRCRMMIKLFTRLRALCNHGMMATLLAIASVATL